MNKIKSMSFELQVSICNTIEAEISNHATHAEDRLQLVLNILADYELIDSTYRREL